MYDNLIIKISKDLYFKKPEIIQALMCQESRGNPHAVRFELGYYTNKIVEAESLVWSKKYKGIPTADTERVMRSTSFGLMQIMGQLAREHGYSPQFLTQLLIAEENIMLGVKILNNWIKKLNGNEDHAILAWNRGPGCAVPIGHESYLVSVKAFIEQTPFL